MDTTISLFSGASDDEEIWVADPGISTIFTAIDFTEHERIRKTILKEYYHLCGYKLAAKKTKSVLPTFKTANLTSILLAASARLQNHQRIHNYYYQDDCTIPDDSHRYQR
ncbi:hypothetical protein BCV72DRAFT_261567 [Rhizopus microsporus var. microsporus]|uniref:Uncharacterized protein n=1 Tax=Rhizopus microsporus var. microsporus TaxID=86635 RepID=A0A1X0R8J9_RHIZD|nr:hypothetical protein BCV72DRAFT_261567 [Rhizopus microsporus var. microsporus]